MLEQALSGSFVPDRLLDFCVNRWLITVNAIVIRVGDKSFANAVVFVELIVVVELTCGSGRILGRIRRNSYKNTL